MIGDKMRLCIYIVGFMRSEDSQYKSVSIFCPIFLRYVHIVRKYLLLCNFRPYSTYVCMYLGIGIRVRG
jgi:hypothetical protein